MAALGVGLTIPAAAQASSLNPTALLDKGALKSFLQQPLFDPTRRPTPAPPPPVVATPVVVTVLEVPPTLHLLGVVGGRGDAAIVRRDDTAKIAILQTGDRIDGWLVKVSHRAVRLEKDGRVSDYALFSGNGVKDAPTAVALGGFGSESPGAEAARSARLRRSY